MTTKYWIKLYHEVLDDPKMGRLDDRCWRRVVELFLLAGEEQDGGFLPDLRDMAWRLRISEAELKRDLDQLAELGIVELLDGQWFVCKFAERQAALPKKEYMQRKRGESWKKDYYQPERQPVTPSNPPCDHGVTDGNADTDTEEESDTDAETDAPPSSVAPKTSPNGQPLPVKFKGLVDKMLTPGPLQNAWRRTTLFEADVGTVRVGCASEEDQALLEGRIGKILERELQGLTPGGKVIFAQGA